MRRAPRAVLAALLLGVAVALGVSACARSAQELPPVITDITTVNGTTVKVPVGGSVDLIGDDRTFTDWSADIADEKVVTFTPGREEGGASFNPGLTALAEGTSSVTLTNSESDETITFTVEVTPASSGY